LLHDWITGAFGRIAKRFRDTNIVCVTHGDCVATYIVHAGFTSSKDNVYETPHCSFASALVADQTWTPADVDPLVGILEDY
jgi:broad specificity phosphatase PhoE